MAEAPVNPKSTLGIHLQRDLVIDVLQLLSLRLEDVETVVIDREELVELCQVRDVLKSVRDDIFDVIDYKADPDSDGKPKPPRLGDPDYDPDTPATESEPPRAEKPETD